MSESVNPLDLVSLDEARAYLRAPEPQYNTPIAMIVKGVSARIQGAMGRRIRSRTWTHDASTLPRLDSEGGTSLWLANTPVTAVSVLKVTPDSGALTEGWNQDFTVDADTGRLRLVNGGCFLKAAQVVETTYVGGYLDDGGSTTASQAYVYGYDERSADIRFAALQQTKFEYDQWRNEEEGILNKSEEGVSITYVAAEFIPRVQAVVDRYRFDPAPSGG